MIRNTRGLVQMDLPPRYAQTLMAQPHGDEQRLYLKLDDYLRRRKAMVQEDLGNSEDGDHTEPQSPGSDDHDSLLGMPAAGAEGDHERLQPRRPRREGQGGGVDPCTTEPSGRRPATAVRVR